MRVPSSESDRGSVTDGFGWRRFFSRALSVWAVAVILRNLIRFRGELGLTEASLDGIMGVVLLGWIFASLWYALMTVNYSRSLLQPGWLRTAYGVMALVGGVLGLIPLLGLFWETRQAENRLGAAEAERADVEA